MLNNILISRDLFKMLSWVKTDVLTIKKENGSQELFKKYLNQTIEKNNLSLWRLQIINKGRIEKGQVHEWTCPFLAHMHELLKT